MSIASKTILALAIIASPHAAMATDVPGSAKTNVAIPLGAAGIKGTFEKAGDSDWYRASLKGGVDYAVAMPTMTEINARFLVHDPSGKVIASENASPQQSVGLEFRAKYAGTYYIEVRDALGRDPPATFPQPYSVRLTTDAPNNASTKATLTIGVTQNRLLTWQDDGDWYRVALVTGQPYTFHAESSVEQIGLALVDANRNPVVGHYDGSSFIPTFTGTYFAVPYGDGNDRDDAIPYSIGFTSP